jgi:hypothetical protein
MTIQLLGYDLFHAVRRTDGYVEVIRRHLKMFLYNVFYNNWHLQACTNYYNNLCCNWPQWNISTSINIGKWPHCLLQRYPAVDCHLYCPVDLLCQKPLFPLNSSLMFPTAVSANFVPDRNEILTLVQSLPEEPVQRLQPSEGGEYYTVVFQRARQTTVSCSTPIVTSYSLK